MNTKFFSFVLALVLCMQVSLPANARERFKEILTISNTNVNAKTIGAVALGTTENGTEDFHPLYVVFKMFGTSIITVPIISVGTNATAYNNVIGLSVLSGLTSNSSMLVANINTAVSSIPPNTTVYANIGTIAVGSTAVLEIHLFGYYN